MSTTTSPDPDAGFDAAAALPDALDFFEQNGYAVLRNAVPRDLCGQLKATFLNRVKPFEGPLLRVNTTRAETHNFSEHGLMTNPLLDVHDIDRAQFPEFHQTVRDILSRSGTVDILSAFLKDEPALVQSMYFESSRGTDPHFDSHIFDASEVGRLRGFWLALEDIDDDAGRFVVYPRSHLLGQDGVFSDAANQAAREYESFSVNLIQGYHLEKKTFSLNSVLKSRKLLTATLSKSGIQQLPLSLRAGDAAVFSSLMLHASLKPGKSGQSRHSLTAHFIPKSAGFQRYRKVDEPLNLTPFGRAWIHEHEPGKGPYAYRNG